MKAIAVAFLGFKAEIINVAWLLDNTVEGDRYLSGVIDTRISN